MAVILSPVPADADSLAEAVVVLGRAIGADAADAERLLETASALVEHHAPAAPQSVRNEATIRVAGALAQSDFGGHRLGVDR